MSSSVSAVSLASLMLQQVLDAEKAHGHGGGHRAGSDRFAELAQREAGIAFVPIPATPPRTPVAVKTEPRRDKRSQRDDTPEEEEARFTDQRQPRRQQGRLDVMV